MVAQHGAHIQAFDCGGGLGLKVVKSPEAAKVGKTIMCGAKKTADNKWRGTVLNLDDNQKYSGYVELNGNSLTLSGCVLAGLICRMIRGRVSTDGRREGRVLTG